jgi:hypothetical protein
MFLMTNDQTIRAVVAAFSIPIYAWLIKQAITKLSASGYEIRGNISYRLGCWLGKIWARTNRAAK